MLSEQKTSLPAISLNSPRLAFDCSEPKEIFKHMKIRLREMSPVTSLPPLESDMQTLRALQLASSPSLSKAKFIRNESNCNDLPRSPS